MLRFVLPAVLGFTLTAANAWAEESKTNPVNLEELKYAVRKADQRGENVGAIVEAVTAFEKALAKFAGKPGEAPPELTELREVVEAAAKKGENVESISKELGLIEKALTGREYERPKPQEPKVEPVPPLQRPGRIGVGVGGRVGNPWGVPGKGGDGVRGGNGNSTSITRSNDRFTVFARKDGITYAIRGQMNAPGTLNIIIIDNGETYVCGSVMELPDEYRIIVEDFLMLVNK